MGELPAEYEELITMKEDIEACSIFTAYVEFKDKQKEIF